VQTESNWKRAQLKNNQKSKPPKNKQNQPQISKSYRVEMGTNRRSAKPDNGRHTQKKNPKTKTTHKLVNVKRFNLFKSALFL